MAHGETASENAQLRWELLRYTLAEAENGLMLCAPRDVNVIKAQKIVRSRNTSLEFHFSK